jgi:glutathione S-transferase
MLHLYHSVGARSLRCLWAFKELGMVNVAQAAKDAAGAAPPAGSYKLTTMPFPPRFHHKPFLELNPLGTIPFLVDEANGVFFSPACFSLAFPRDDRRAARERRSS